MHPRGNNEGVSPIIATILMVAVTIVLAGVLYVMIIGMGGGSNENLAPLGSWHSVSAVNSTSAKLVFGPFSAEVKPIDIKLFLYEGDSNQSTEITIQTPLAGQNDNPCTVTGHNSTSINAAYTDYAYSTNTVNGGDFLIINGLVPGQYYRVVVFHAPSQSVLSMSGNSGSFQMP